MKVLLVTAFLSTFSASAFAAKDYYPGYKDVTVHCSVSDSDDMKGKDFDFFKPYGGGQVAQAKLKDGSTLDFTIMLEQNEDDQNLLNITVMVENKSINGTLQLAAKGVSENKYKANGVYGVVYYGKQAMDSVRIFCGI